MNLAASLADRERRVLLVDLDPQGNATTGCGVDKQDLEQTTCDVLLGDARIHDVIYSVAAGDFALLPANSDLTAAEVRLLQEIGRELRLRQALEPIRGLYDYLLIDCPPTINMLTLNALTAADGVLIPIQCEYYALEGLTSLLETVKQVRNTVNHGSKSKACCAPCMTHVTSWPKRFPHSWSSTLPTGCTIPWCPATCAWPRRRVSACRLMYHDRGSAGAKAYLQLADEMIARERPAQG